MTQEDKLLLKDLCTRLPYGVKVKTPYNDAILIGLIKRKGFQNDEYYIDAITDKQTYPVRYIQPYLRPMSNMTEEEKEEYDSIQCDFGIVRIDRVDEIAEFLLSHHFDFVRTNDGLTMIEAGLALEAPEGIYNLNK